MKSNLCRLFVSILALLLASLACNFGRNDGTSIAPTITPMSLAGTNTPETTSTPSTPSIALGAEYRSDAGGFAFYQVPGWITTKDAFSVFHEPPNADIDKGPSFLMAGTTYDVDLSVDEAYNDFIISFVEGGDAPVSLGSPTALIVSGAPARIVDVAGRAEDGSPVKGKALVVQVSPRHTFVFLGFATDSLWDNEVSYYFTAVVNSLWFFEPKTAETTIESPDGYIRQWAMDAYASSEYTETGWSASQATGYPDVYPDCGDIDQAWAPRDYGTTESLNVYFEEPVIATEVHIYETYNPGYVIAVDLIGVDGSINTVYNEVPEIVEDCSAVLSVYPTLNIPVNGVVVYIDTTELNDWAEIDAVELVGFPISE